MNRASALHWKFKYNRLHFSKYQAVFQEFGDINVLSSYHSATSWTTLLAPFTEQEIEVQYWGAHAGHRALRGGVRESQAVWLWSSHHTVLPDLLPPPKALTSTLPGSRTQTLAQCSRSCASFHGLGLGRVQGACCHKPLGTLCLGLFPG